MHAAQPFISICIPAYRRLDFLKRLLKSIDSQTYRNFEVVITDDSGDDTSIEEYISTCQHDFTLFYFKNITPLGSPRNWLESFEKAKGIWIKVMHDDDIFLNSSSLATYAEQISNNTDVLFSGYFSMQEETGKKTDMTISIDSFRKISKHPFRLFSINKIGPPSAMLFKKSISEKFDDRLKWIVDWEYYIRLFLNYKVEYFSSPLVIVSYNESQITNSCYKNPHVEIPEAMILHDKYGEILFADIILFDAWWRLMRNLNIRSIAEFSLYYGGSIPKQLKSIISFQSFIPVKVLSVGLFSKLLMLLCYTYARIDHSLQDLYTSDKNP